MALPMNYRVRTLRGPNSVLAHADRMTSADGKRWACGRYVKCPSPRGRGYYETVYVWNLKTRDENGKVVTVEMHRDEAEARAWCGITEG